MTLFELEITFQRNVPENEKRVFKRSILCLDKVVNGDVARVLEQIVKIRRRNISVCFKYGHYLIEHKLFF